MVMATLQLPRSGFSSTIESPIPSIMVKMVE
jgi:hypothetical protein